MIKDMLLSTLEKKAIFVSKIPTLSASLRNFFAANEINLVLDVGAFNGSYCRLLRDRVGYQGRIVSFEPCAASFRNLKDRMSSDKNWNGFHFGLSDSDGTATLNTFGRGEFNSVLNLRENGSSAFQLDSTSTPETIQLKKLETAWRDVTAGVDRPKCFLKIDTQGHDLAVAVGASKVLPSIYGIQSELASIEIYDGMKSMPQALQMYSDIGFVPFGFYPVNIVESYGSPFEFDVLLRRPLPGMRT